MAATCVAMNEDFTPARALKRNNCCRCHRFDCVQAASRSWLQACASHETRAIHPPISSAYSGLTCMEMQRMWSSSLTHTRNVLSLLWKMPRASGQSRAAPQLASTLLGVGFWNRKPSACAIGCQGECSFRERTRRRGQGGGKGPAIGMLLMLLGEAFGRKAPVCSTPGSFIVGEKVPCRCYKPDLKVQAAGKRQVLNAFRGSCNSWCIAPQHPTQQQQPHPLHKAPPAACPPAPWSCHPGGSRCQPAHQSSARTQ